MTDTWEFDGTQWELKAPASSPGVRGCAGMVYDTVRQRVVLFGGGIAQWERDLWEWDGANWVEMGPADCPASGIGYMSAYDTVRQCIVGVREGADSTWELPSNRPPRVTASFSPAVPRPGQTVTLAAAFSDPDGDTPTFRWFQTYGLPVTLTGATGASASFTPAATGSYGFEVTASDGRDAVAYAIGAVSVNSPPVAHAGPDRTAGRGSTVVLTGTASDLDGDTLSYSWARSTSPGSGPEVALTGAGTARPSFTPPALGTYTFRLTVTDTRGGSAIGEVTVTVANRRPSVSVSGPTAPVLGGTRTTFQAAATDPDGDLLGVTWTQSSGLPLALEGASTATLAVTPTQPGHYAFRVEARDPAGLTATAEAAVDAALDLVAVGLSTAPALPTTADAVVFTATVRNLGATSSPSFSCSIQLAGLPGVSLGALTLWAGETRVLTSSATGPLPAGQRQATLLVDSSGAVPETQEANNSYVLSFGVVDVAAPDDDHPNSPGLTAEVPGSSAAKGADDGGDRIAGVIVRAGPFEAPGADQPPQPLPRVVEEPRQVVKRVGNARDGPVGQPLDFGGMAFGVGDRQGVVRLQVSRALAVAVDRGHQGTEHVARAGPVPVSGRHVPTRVTRQPQVRHQGAHRLRVADRSDAAGRVVAAGARDCLQGGCPIITWTELVHRTSCK
ncbi:MAG: hypothetical protein HY814_05110 [Candidatus Riflebacteria bacterium]|nr:hypothetical protein [Candidatus Riflebacteria bacterium]